MARAPEAEQLARANELLAADKFIALDDLLKSSSKQLDDSQDLQAQLWSLLWFLDQEHRELFHRYMSNWRVNHTDAATSYAFELLDRAELERQWRAYIPTIK